MNFLFLMDPLETVKRHTDTSYIFMEGAHKRAHRVFYLPLGGIVLKEGKVYFKCTEVSPRDDSSFPFEIIGHIELCEDQVGQL